jgi:oligoendopeptidase F
MPAKSRRSVSPFVANNSLPPLLNVKTEWDLQTHFYQHENDPQIEADVHTTLVGYQAFAKKYAKVDITKSAKVLATMLRDYMALAHLPGEKALYYFHYRHTRNATDHVAEQKLTLFSDRLTKANNLVVFVPLTIGKLQKAKQREYLKAPELKPYRYYLERVFLEAKHSLSEAEEKILNLKSLPARSLWVAGTDKILNRKTVTYKGKQLPLNEAIEKTASIAPKERPALWNVVTTELKQWAEVAENELNAIVLDKKINDELRGFKKPYEARIQGYQNDLESVEALVTAISNEGFALSQRFYKAKARFHGVQSLPYASKYDPVGEQPTIIFRDAVEICREVFYKTKTDYGTFFDEMLTRGQIDVYPRPNRSGGAFMSSAVGLPTFVFLNHVDEFKSLETLAHEMGHAIHSSRSKVGQPSWYEDYSTTTAETASTFFENLVFAHVYEQAAPETKFALLHDRITRDIATIQRQIAFFNFEVALHNRIRTEGGMTKGQIAVLMQQHLQSYFGKAVTVTEDDGYSFVFVGHFRSMFYVYTYAYGLLMSTLMSKRYHEDRRYIGQIDHFLQSGGSATVEHIFRAIGIDAHKPETFIEALSSLRTDISEFEHLAKRQK